MWRFKEMAKDSIRNKLELYLTEFLFRRLNKNLRREEIFVKFLNLLKIQKILVWVFS